MTFRDNNGRELLFDGDFAITKQAVSIFNGSIKGDVSITFQVDNNSINREILNYKGPMMTSQVAFQKQFFNRIRNGNFLDSGYIVIQEEDGPYLKCFYMSGNSNWIQLLQGLITELDYTSKTNNKDYVKQFSSSSFVTSSEGITFPFIDWCFNKKKGDNQYKRAPTTAICLVDVTGDVLHPLIQFYPCFYLHSLVNEIFSQNGIKKDGNIFQDGLYESLAITPSEGLITRDNFLKVFISGSSQAYPEGVAFFTYVKITELKLTNGPEMMWDDVSKSFIPDRKCGLKVSMTIKSGTASQYSVWLRKNGVRTVGLIFTSEGVKRSIPQTLPTLSTDIWDLVMEIGNFQPAFNATVDVEFEIPEVILGDDYINPGDFLPSLKSIDIVKFMVNVFGCAVYFDSISKSITITIIEKLKLEDAYDWSKYYVSHSSQYIDNAAHNFISWTESEDSTIAKYNREHTLNFADGDLVTDNSLLEQKKICDFPFAASSASLGFNGIYCLDIPLINLIDDGDPILFTSVEYFSDFRSRFVTGLPGVIKSNEVVRITDGDGLNIGYYYGALFGARLTYEAIAFQFIETFTGKIYRQRISYQKISPRIVSVKPNTPITEYSSQTAIFEAESQLNNNFDYAVFTKSLTGFPIDQWKNNLAIDNPDIDNFTDPTIKELYFNKISRFIKNPKIRAVMRLPDSVYQKFKFDQFIYLKTENLTGYFFVDIMPNYVDGDTPHEVIFYML